MLATVSVTPTSLHASRASRTSITRAISSAVW
jgi:hypothetical protein